MTLPPAGGRIYVDADAFICSVERVDPYYPLLRPMWHASARREFTMCANQLLVLKSLTGPLKRRAAEAGEPV